MKKHLHITSRKKNKGSALARRIKGFSEMRRIFEHEAPSPLIAVHAIDKELLKHLQDTVATYVSKSLPFDDGPLEEKNLINAYEEFEKSILCVTPNGIIVPKRNTTLEFNNVVKALMKIVENLGISAFIKSWYIPLNVRIKFGHVHKKDLKRAHATETTHSDSWTGLSSESVIIHIPLFGDTYHNSVHCYDPPLTFQEDWLGPRLSYDEGTEIVKRYKPIDFVCPKGSVMMLDTATLHSTRRLPGCGSRISLDAAFVLRKEGSDENYDGIHPMRENEHLSPEKMFLIGEKYMFVFSDSPDEIVTSDDRFKHAANLKLTRILE